MSREVQFSGFAEADQLLSKLPLLLRGQVLDKTLKSAIKRLAAASAAKAPQPGAAVGGIKYTPRRGERASRKRLYQAISSVIRKYDGGETIVAVGGPVRRLVGGHAHLIEFGWNHTSGGTLKNSGGRTRYAMATTRFDRVQLGPAQQNRVMWKRVRERVKEKDGTGRINRQIPGRSFINAAFEQNKANVQAEIMTALRKFADDVEKQAAKEAAKRGN